ncbi:hypothetical protein TEA_016124 [Camellia sinensis var. sinensis]|uniref:SRP54-type proteins GTP-binding domain-containing protein n=1 Tax=Camellia sinensis var. sinensis TaxID=542762 RepID=A0A4S4DJQ4_CAMSN|nr:hypothetical protein TEA_016124 [Camellia sinensis var. sinensis]
MLEQLLIFTRGGLILWTCKELGNALKGSPIDTLIRSCLLEERSGAASYNYDAPGAAYTLKWTFHNELGLVFVALYQRILHLLYVDDLLAMVKQEFSAIYDPKQIVYNDFDDVFRQLRKEAEARAEEMKKSKPVNQPTNNNIGKKQGQVQKSGFQGGNKKKSSGESDGGDGENKNGRKKENEHSNGNHVAIDELPTTYVANGKENNGAFDVNKLQKLRAKGESMMDKDEIVSSDSESEEEEEEENDSKTETKKKGWFSSMFQSIAGKANLEKADLEPALKALKDKLMTKNVVCLLLSTSSSYCSSSWFFSTLFAASFLSLRSIDILRDVHAAKEQRKPYVVVFVGVNGVGKSTNLAKVAYWLQQHKVNVMMAACDTFRSGAVEQLRTHARRLQIPIFEKGYEKDPAIVAKEAIQEATRNGSDVVLVDTAGRMQDNEPLMRALSKLINLNNPDLVLFVGEALVGNDAVDQLLKFNQKLADLSASPNPRLIDGILLTKFDTIDDKVGAALSMVYISGAPVMFVGCGQSYTDLKKLNVKSIVKTLLK